MNWVVLATGFIILIGFLVGVFRGAVRIAVSLLTTIVTLILVVILTPYASQAIMKLTPLDDMIQEQVSSAIISAATAGAATEEEGVLTEDGVRGVLGAAGISEEDLASYGIKIEDIVNGKVSGDDLAQYGISRNILDGLKDRGAVQEVIENVEIPRDMQMSAIEASELPEVFKSLLSTNNNNEIYKELGVENFVQYVGSFLAKLLINIVAFLCVFLLVTIVMRAIIFALDIVSELPVFGFLDRLAGGAVGVLCALVIVWIMFIVITLLYVASIGTDFYEMIQANTLTKLLYEYNPIMKLATRI
ncbi:CvpA family protein [Lachnospiraceae bacterium 42-17]|jgi:uncharacterized membrane protein required for colicin V production|nr:CvpA family protein [Dorea sp.]